MNGLSFLLAMSVNLVQCDEKSLVFVDGYRYISTDFFNIVFDEEYRNEACLYLMEASEIKIEEEPLIQNAYYIYADEIMMQEIIVENEWGRVMIQYPEYLHEFKKEDVQVIAKPQVARMENHSIIILISLFLLSIFFWTLLLAFK